MSSSVTPKFQIYHTEKQLANFETTNKDAFIKVQGGGGRTVYLLVSGSTAGTHLSQFGGSDGMSTTNLSLDNYGKIGIKKLYPTTELEVDVSYHHYIPLPILRDIACEGERVCAGDISPAPKRKVFFRRIRLAC